MGNLDSGPKPCEGKTLQRPTLLDARSWSRRLSVTDQQLKGSTALLWTFGRPFVQRLRSQPVCAKEFDLSPPQSHPSHSPGDLAHFALQSGRLCAERHKARKRARTLAAPGVGHCRDAPQLIAQAVEQAQGAEGVYCRSYKQSPPCAFTSSRQQQQHQQSTRAKRSQKDDTP